MNSRQLLKLGVPEHCVKEAIQAVQKIVGAAASGGARPDVKRLIKAAIDNPNAYLADESLGEFARALVDVSQFVRAEPITYRTWGDHGIEPESHVQMRQACGVPVAAAAALMPDAHVGYGLPIGGVLACENAVIPYAVGVDIACRMKLSVLDMPVETIDSRFDHYRQALENGTRFGVGVQHQQPAVARRDGPGLERHADHARAQGQARGSSSAPPARATTSSSSAC